ncbi:hypothetical protein [Paenibacillus pabuli]|uniref:hypothetical protein n=1 Tax=Paenibacillus pabuli TaxID=1472 RepID=UPI001FFE68D0|nr:hypothetical protein [Paenibacillus pabuli]UPK42634.1 hypothetical protein KET34_26190 [Paenibacillus pabuli]
MIQTRRKVFISFIACLLFIPSVASAQEAQLRAPVVKAVKVKVKKNCPLTKVKSEEQKEDGDRTVKDIVILEPLQTLIDEYKLNKTDEKIEVSIMLRYDLNISKQNFLKTKFSAFKDAVTDREGFGGYSFFAKLTITEIEEVSIWDAISTISLPSDTVSIY